MLFVSIFFLSHVLIQNLLRVSLNEFEQVSRLKFLYILNFFFCLSSTMIFDLSLLDMFIYLNGGLLYIFFCLLSMRSIRLRQLSDLLNGKVGSYDSKELIEKRLTFLLESGQISLEDHHFVLKKGHLKQLDDIFLFWRKWFG